MRIARVHIQHYRSIKETEFEPRPYCVLDDENNYRKWDQSVIQTVGNEHVFWFKPSFEGELGLPNKTTTKIDYSLKLFSKASKNNIPEYLRTPIIKLMEDL